MGTTTTQSDNSPTPEIAGDAFSWSRRHTLRAAGLCLLLLATAWWFWPRLLPAGNSNPTPQPTLKSKYSVPPGLYEQTNADSGQHLLSVDSDGQGRLVVMLPTVSSFVIGASRVEMETTWVVDGDDVTFLLQGGEPEAAYRRLLAVALEEETRFHIREWEANALTLERVTDGELFEWERIADEPLPKDTEQQLTGDDAADTSPQSD